MGPTVEIVISQVRTFAYWTLEGRIYCIRYHSTAPADLWGINTAFTTVQITSTAAAVSPPVYSSDNAQPCRIQQILQASISRWLASALDLFSCVEIGYCDTSLEVTCSYPHFTILHYLAPVGGSPSILVKQIISEHLLFPLSWISSDSGLCSGVILPESIGIAPCPGWARYRSLVLRRYHSGSNQRTVFHAHGI